MWQMNSHPLFAESNARHRAVAFTKMRRLLLIIGIGTILTVFAWTGITFVGESTREIPDPENTNETIKIEVPRLMIGSSYPWDAKVGMAYIMSFIYQVGKKKLSVLYFIDREINKEIVVDMFFKNITVTKFRASVIFDEVHLKLSLNVAIQ